ncbi:MAG: gamma-glutamyltransferase, partial [Verrucomicrobiales bacterium]|nr:gamma-glutamyltransferase [Verrucomicrobiales bacterium]
MNSCGFVLVVWGVVVGLGVSAMAADRITGRDFATRSEVIAQHGMAATSQPLATQVALDVLKAGGSAVDAAIAANAVLGLVEPTGSGIGGDLFAIVWDAESGKLHGLNASGRSPAGLTMEMFEELEPKRIPTKGVLTTSVPGCVDGWFELHGKFGKLPMSEVLAPAVGYARDGFPVTEVIAAGWERSVEVLGGEAGFLETFAIDGKAPAKGDVFRNPGLAKTLEAIGAGGRDVFYKGDVAHGVDVFMKEVGGYLRYED